MKVTPITGNATKIPTLTINAINLSNDQLGVDGETSVIMARAIITNVSKNQIPVAISNIILPYPWWLFLPFIS